MERDYTCFFTGHRIIANKIKSAIAARIEREAAALIEDKGVADFITGGALGFDTMAARAIINLKKQYSFIKLHLYLPCYDHMRSWNLENQYEARMIMTNADSKIFVTDSKYITGCMQLRNKRMADDAKYCIAYLNNPRSGTAYTVSYAEGVGDIITNICETE